MQEIQSLWHESNLDSNIRTSNSFRDNLLLIKSEYSMISLGTERLVCTAQVPKSMHASMEVPYMEGAFELPVKYGYSLVGKVITEDHRLTGKLVHLLHPHQDYCWVDEKMLFEIPEEVEASLATLASNLETSVNAVWDAGVSIGDRVLIVGFGLVGSLVARLVSMIAGTQVEVLDTNERKKAEARRLGFSLATLGEEERHYDIAFNCSASSSGLQSCIDATGFESKIIELSWYGEKAVQVNLGTSFHQQRKKIISSQVSNLPMNKQTRWSFGRRKKLVFNLLKNPIFQQHINCEIDFEDSPAFFKKMRKGEVEALVIVVKY